jgi:hypothetical protein
VENGTFIARQRPRARVRRIGVLMAGDENESIFATGELARIVSGCRLTNSCASAQIRLMSPLP